MSLSAHKGIWIKFEVENRRYEAVGFLKERERLIYGDIMLARTATENGGAIGEEDEMFLLVYQEKLPAELKRYRLVTNRRNPDDSQYVSCFGFNGSGWREMWRWIGRRWNHDYLVLRRCA